MTPSHHRVHHAINKEYLDKNLSQIFIIWDKLFGTFQEELDDVPPVYGVTRPVRTWNPIIINFVHLWQLITDAWRTNSWKAKFTIWFKPTGWRPEDVKAKYPVKGIEDPYHYEKYDPKVSRALQWWSWIQFTAVFSLMMYLFNHLADIGAQQSIVYGLFLVLCIFSYSMLMDKSRYSLAIEVLKSLIGLAFIFLQGNWFGMPAGFSALVAAYFLLSIGIVAYFSFSELKKDEAPLKAF